MYWCLFLCSIWSGWLRDLVIVLFFVVFGLAGQQQENTCTQGCTISRRPAFCWKWTQRSVLQLLLLLQLLLQLIYIYIYFVFGQVGCETFCLDYDAALRDATAALKADGEESSSLNLGTFVSKR